MKYDFDEIIPRKGTDSCKYDFSAENGFSEDIIPMWVADMDFRVSEEISAALKKRAGHGIFGYTEVKEDYFVPIKNWYMNYFGWTPDYDWLIKTPGVVYATAAAIRAFTKEGDPIMIQPPVYYPFRELIVSNRRKVVNNPLIYDEGRYVMDFADAEAKIKEHNVKLFILCSPHNPVGRVWSEEELRTLGNICLDRNVTVLSDEIHSDFTWNGNKHSVFAALSPEFAQNSIICTSPSKTFNLAGLQISNIFIPDPVKREKFRAEMRSGGYTELNIMGLEACRAAYTCGRDWFEQVKDYIYGNIEFAENFLKENIPRIKPVKPQGTYLFWADCRGLGLKGKALDRFMAEKAKLWLDGGSIFGKEGEYFQRFNLACPRAVLKEALERLKKGTDEL